MVAEKFETSKRRDMKFTEVYDFYDSCNYDLSKWVQFRIL